MRLAPLVGNVEWATEPEVLLPGDDGWTDPQVEFEKQLEEEAAEESVAVIATVGPTTTDAELERMAEEIVEKLTPKKGGRA
jgi:predicted Zn-dependent protease